MSAVPRRIVVQLLLAILLGSLACGADPESLGNISFFESRIRPVLVEHCYECHSQGSDESEGGLRLDTRADLRKGGESGPALIEGDSEQSLLMQALRYEGLEMPPDRKLPARILADFQRWIGDGAVDPRVLDSTTADEKVGIDIDAGAEFWSFQPLQVKHAPNVSNRDWPRTGIDRFILNKLESISLQPAEDANRAAILRRLFVDLIGLPPTIEQQESFLQNDDPAAYEKWVNELLMSPHFGERWGRHWLDLARFAESTGGGSSALMYDAWKYRDYVIDSFNGDKAYDQFLRQQIAGDLLPWSDLEERANNVVATGFLVLGARNYITDDETIFRMDGIDEQVTTVGHAILGMTLDCARCHDHKFDPIPTHDYYALGGILGSTVTAKLIPGSKNFIWNTCSDPREDPDGSQYAAYESKSAEASVAVKIVAKLRRDLAYARETGSLPVDVDANTRDSVDEWIAENSSELKRLESELAALRAAIPTKPSTFMAVSCEKKPTDLQIRIRGNAHRPSDLVNRGFIQVVSRGMRDDKSQDSIPTDQSGRLQLADWLTSPQNPLTARVLVNRVWQHLFGRGIVATANNFGTTGELPTHPELLDWLSHQFMQEGWSIKTLVRNIVMSRTYQLSATNQHDEQNIKDPGNFLLGRHSRRSLDAETMRDTMLFVSGELQLAQLGRSFAATLRTELDHKFVSNRRSVYVPRFRNHQYDLFQAFDAANPAMVVGKRDETILPTQAMLLMNHDFVIDRARESAKQILAVRGTNDTQRIEQMYLRTLAREPSANEMELASEFIGVSNGRAIDERLHWWTALQQTLFQCVDFRFVQ